MANPIFSTQMANMRISPWKGSVKPTNPAPELCPSSMEDSFSPCWVPICYDAFMDECRNFNDLPLTTHFSVGTTGFRNSGSVNSQTRTKNSRIISRKTWKLNDEPLRASLLQLRRKSGLSAPTQPPTQREAARTEALPCPKGRPVAQREAARPKALIRYDCLTFPSRFYIVQRSLFLLCSFDPESI